MERSFTAKGENMIQDRKKEAQCIVDKKAVLGIEFGSTRIKAVLIDEEQNPIAQGSFCWENQLKNGIICGIKRQLLYS